VNAYTPAQTLRILDLMQGHGLRGSAAMERVDAELCRSSAPVPPRRHIGVSVSIVESLRVLAVRESDMASNIGTLEMRVVAAAWRDLAEQLA
jgi:hypothetical protein